MLALKYLSYIATMQLICVILLVQMENGLENLLYMLLAMLAFICIGLGYFLAVLAHTNWSDFNLPIANNKTVLVASDNQNKPKIQSKKLKVEAKI